MIIEISTMLSCAHRYILAYVGTRVYLFRVHTK